MSADFEWVLEDCLKRLRGGQSSEECLSDYPDRAEELRPLLLLAGNLHTAPLPQPRLRAIEQGRERMLEAARLNLIGSSSIQPVSSGAFSRYTVRIFTTIKAFLLGKETHGMKLALRLAIDLVVMLMIGGVVAVNASATSLPGESLYGIKRTWEEVRLNLTVNDAGRQQLQEHFLQLRQDEVRRMIQLGRTGLVDFEGQLESIAAEEWVVSGIRVRMLAGTIVEGDPIVGQTARVKARLQSGGVLTALQVQMQTRANSPIPYPPPAATHTPTQTGTPARTPQSTQNQPAYTGEPAHGPVHEPAYTGEPMHGPAPAIQPTAEPSQQPGLNDQHHDNMPVPTLQPTEDYHNDNDPCHDCDHHDDPGDSYCMGCGSGSHHRRP